MCGSVASGLFNGDLAHYRRCASSGALVVDFDAPLTAAVVRSMRPTLTAQLVADFGGGLTSELVEAFGPELTSRLVLIFQRSPTGCES
jgi:hypothetical protein